MFSYISLYKLKRNLSKQNFPSEKISKNSLEIKLSANEQNMFTQQEKVYEICHEFLENQKNKTIITNCPQKRKNQYVLTLKLIQN